MANVPDLGPQRGNFGGTQFNPGDPRGAFGEKAAEANFQAAQGLIGASEDVAAVSQSLQEADNRMKDREDAVTKAKRLAAVKEKAQKIKDDAEKKGKLSTQDGLTQVRAQLDSLYATEEQSYVPLRKANSFRFQVALAQQQGEINLNLNTAHINATRTEMKGQATEKVRQFAGVLTDDPGAFEDVQQQYAEWLVEHYYPTMPESEQIAQWNEGMAQLTKIQLDNAMISTDYDQVRKMLKSPDISQYIDPAVAAGYRMNLYRVDKKKFDDKIEEQRKVKAIKDLGLKPEEEKRVLAQVIAKQSITFEPKKGPKTVADKLQEAKEAWQLIHPDEELPTAVAERVVSKVDLAPGIGSGHIGKLWTAASDDAADFRDGNMTEAEATRWLDTVFALGTTVDPILKTTPELSPLVREALESRGIDVHSFLNVNQPNIPQRGVSASGAVQQFGEFADQADSPAFDNPIDNPEFGGVSTPTPAAAPTPVPAATGPDASAAEGASLDVPESGKQAEIDADISNKMEAEVTHVVSPLTNAMNQMPTTPTGQPDPAQAAEVFRRNGVNFYVMADDIRGVVSGFQDHLSRIPGLGKIFSADAIVQARTAVVVLPGLIADAMKRTDREAAGEQRFEEEKFRSEIEPAFFAEPERMKNVLIGVDRMLEREAQFIKDTLSQQGSVDNDRVRTLTNRLNKIQNVRAVVSAPPIVNAETEKEAQEGIAKVYWERGLRVGDFILFNKKLLPILREPERPQGAR